MIRGFSNSKREELQYYTVLQFFESDIQAVAMVIPAVTVSCRWVRGQQGQLWAHGSHSGGPLDTAQLRSGLDLGVAEGSLQRGAKPLHFGAFCYTAIDN